MPPLHLAKWKEIRAFGKALCSLNEASAPTFSDSKNIETWVASTLDDDFQEIPTRQLDNFDKMAPSQKTGTP